MITQNKKKGKGIFEYFLKLTKSGKYAKIFVIMIPLFYKKSVYIGEELLTMTMEVRDENERQNTLDGTGRIG